MSGGWDEYDDVEPPPAKSRTGHFRIGTGFPGETDYQYAKVDEEFGDLTSHLSMTVGHERARATYSYPEGPSATSGSRSEHMIRQADKDLFDQPGGQGKLFGMATSPGRSTVEWLSGTKEGRVHTLTMLGIAQNRTQRDYGRDLEPSDNLSPHSSKLVGNLARRGVLQGDTVSEISNDYTFQRRPIGINPDDSEPIPASEAKQGKRTMARTLKANRKPAAEPSSGEKRGRPYEARRR